MAVADDGQCSLPEAIGNANNDSQLYASAGECAAGAGADTITLGGGTYTLNSAYGGSAYGSDNGLPPITSEIVIDGNSATIERDTVTPAPDFRILAVRSGGDLTMNDTTISGGNAGVFGGGGIYNRGTATLTNSTVSGNSAEAFGGGIDNAYGGTVTLTNSTVSGNVAYYGGGILNNGTATLTNSTVSGNMAYDGGGIYNGTATLTNSTVSGNAARLGGGILTATPSR